VAEEVAVVAVRDSSPLDADYFDGPYFSLNFRIVFNITKSPLAESINSDSPQTSLVPTNSGCSGIILSG